MRPILVVLVLGWTASAEGSGQESPSARWTPPSVAVGEVLRWTVRWPATQPEPVQWLAEPGSGEGWTVLRQESRCEAGWQEEAFDLVADRAGELPLGAVRMVVGAGDRRREHTLAQASVSVAPLVRGGSDAWEPWLPGRWRSGGRDALLALSALLAGAGLGAVLARGRRRRSPSRREEPRAWALHQLAGLRRRTRAGSAGREELDALAQVLRADLESRGEVSASRMPLGELAAQEPVEGRDLLQRLESYRFAGVACSAADWARALAQTEELLDRAPAGRGAP